MSLISVTNLTFGYEGSYDNIFENVSFQIDTNWKLGFTGRNGRGKTTFLNLLLGKYSYSGNIKSDVTMEYFPYQVDDMSKYGIEIMKSICPFAEDWEFIKEASLLDVDAETLYRPFNTLSNGERTKVLLASLFLTPNHFLLIDEPTTYLDADARRIVGEYLKNKKGFILVSHDRMLLDSCVDHIIAINRNNIEIQQGNFSTWWHNKKLQDEFELSQSIKLQKEITKLKQSARQISNWSDKVEKSKKGTNNSGSKIDRGFVGHKSAKMMKRAKNQENRISNALSQKSKLLKNIQESDSLKISSIPFPKNTLVNAVGLSLYYDDKPVSCDISFQINQGDRVLLKGKNGSGKSTLLKLICGENIQYSGILEIGSNLKISYVSQETDYLKGSLSEYAEKCGIEESLFKSILRKLGFERTQLEKKIENLSAGQKKKTLIARSLCEKAHLFVWDEPLNYIDIISRIQIEELLLEYQPTMVFVEHDIAFQDNITTKVIQIDKST